jgi:hypothetical protein
MAVDPEAGAKLHAHLESIGIPVVTVRTTADGFEVVCVNAGQQPQADAVAAAWATELRVPRLPRAIMADLLAQVNTAALRDAIIADLLADITVGGVTAARWRFARSEAVWSCWPVFKNATGQTKTDATLVAVAFYCIEFPTYLVGNPNPALAGLNIPGDEPG